MKGGHHPIIGSTFLHTAGGLYILTVVTVASPWSLFILYKHCDDFNQVNLGEDFLTNPSSGI